MTDEFVESQFQMISSSLQPATLTEGVIKLPAMHSNCLADEYHRHSEKMIKRLETAGLGFYVRATETQQKLGTYVHFGIPRNFFASL